MENEQLKNPIINEYFEKYHNDNISPVSFAKMIINKYFPRQNIYHSGKHHIGPMLDAIMFDPVQTDRDLENQFVGFFFALFHDAAGEDISRSRELLNHYVNINANLKFRRLFEMVHEAIQATTYSFENIDFLEDHVKYCVMFDVCALNSTDHKEILDNEQLIFKEYQHVHYPMFVEKRIEGLRHIYKICNLNEDALRIREDHLLHWKPKIAIFPGTFDPFHIGHMNVLKQAEQQFDKVVIAKGHNSQKPISTKVIEKLRQTLPHHQVDEYHGMLTDYIKAYYCVEDVTVIRGLRNGQDLQYEQNLRAALRDMEPRLNIVYYVCDAEVSHISSSLCREVQASPQYQKYVTIENYEQEY